MALGKTIHNLKWVSSHITKSKRIPLAVRVTKKTTINNWPITTCNDVAGYVDNCGALQNAILNRFNNSSRATIITGNSADIVNLEWAWYMTCADLITCPAFIALQATVTNISNNVTALGTPFYQTIYTTGFGAHAQREWLAFWPEFIITDDDVNDRTIIQIDPAYFWGGSAVDDYVVSWSYSSITKNLTLVRNLWGTVVIDLSWIIATTAEQSFPASLSLSVTCNHNLNKHPNPVCVDNTWNLIVPANVSYASTNSLTVTFNQAFTGTVFCA